MHSDPGHGGGAEGAANGHLDSTKPAVSDADFGSQTQNLLTLSETLNPLQ